ncbi:zinc-binding domain-containing protein [Aspergillus germanicus]
MVRPITNSMRPALHPPVSTALESSTPPLKFTFNPNNTDKGCIKSYDTNIMGKFICRRRGCHHVWTSKKIAITIRLYRDNQYNARVYHQHCKKCHWVWKPKVDEKCYVKRTVYRLKKWSGCKDMEVPVYNKGNGKGPHISKLCEGCKAGHCKQSEVDDDKGEHSEGDSSWTKLSDSSISS